MFEQVSCCNDRLKSPKGTSPCLHKFVYHNIVDNAKFLHTYKSLKVKLNVYYQS
ncbi:hypothetical protein Hanom_Chr06g00493111 [Helianthus anomalus]